MHKYLFSVYIRFQFVFQRLFGFRCLHTFYLGIVNISYACWYASLHGHAISPMIILFLEAQCADKWFQCVLWIGGNDRDNEGSFVWSSDNPQISTTGLQQNPTVTPAMRIALGSYTQGGNGLILDVLSNDHFSVRNVFPICNQR